MAVVRQAGLLLLAALLTSRGLFAQDPVDSATAPAARAALPAGAAATVPVDQLKVLLRPTEIRYVQQESRSEEHTSELQSHHDLVCRLLLEINNNLSLGLWCQLEVRRPSSALFPHILGILSNGGRSPSSQTATLNAARYLWPSNASCLVKIS